MNEAQPKPMPGPKEMDIRPVLEYEEFDEAMTLEQIEQEEQM